MLGPQEDFAQPGASTSNSLPIPRNASRQFSDRIICPCVRDVVVRMNKEMQIKQGLKRIFMTIWARSKYRKFYMTALTMSCQEKRSDNIRFYHYSSGFYARYLIPTINPKFHKRIHIRSEDNKPNHPPAPIAVVILLLLNDTSPSWGLLFFIPTISFLEGDWSYVPLHVKSKACGPPPSWQT